MLCGFLIQGKAAGHFFSRQRDIKMPAKTIDDVIQQLDDIIGWAHRQKSRLNYFAAFTSGDECAYQPRSGCCRGANQSRRCNP
jgi:hypothetical protein